MPSADANAQARQPAAMPSVVANASRRPPVKTLRATIAMSAPGVIVSSAITPDEHERVLRDHPPETPMVPPSTPE